MRTGNYHVFRA